MTGEASELAGTFSAEHLREWTWISPKQFAKAHLSRYMPVFQPLDTIEPDHFEVAEVLNQPAPPAPAEQDAEGACYLVKEGDSVWSIAREIVESRSDCAFDPEVRRQDTRKVAVAIAQAYGVFHPDHVELVPGSRIHVAIQEQGVAARRAA